MESVALFLDAELNEQKTQKKENRKRLRNESNIRELSDAAFKKNFRLNKSAFAYVLEQIKEKYKTNQRSDCVTPEHKLAACLRFFAKGNYQHGVGNDFECTVGQSTFSIILKETLDIMEETLCSNWISLHMSEEECELSKTNFFEKTGFPGVIGCVDGTHVQIIAPAENKHLFLNRKGNFSLNVMIICDYKMKIRAVNANYQGANHDSHVWALSPERRYFERRYLSGSRNSFLLGDSGYPLEPWLMTPYRTPTPQSARSRFNICHRKARNIVERSIGLLKGRFRCLLGARQLHYAPLKAAQIVNVCCALHNMCLHFDSSYEIFEHDVNNMEEELHVNNMEEELEIHDIQANLLRSEAATIRNEIVQLNFNT